MASVSDFLGASAPEQTQEESGIQSLVNTGQLRNSITYEIRRKKQQSGSSRMPAKLFHFRLENAMRNLLGAMLLVLLAGCATTPTPSESADPVPGDRLYAYQQNTGGEATLVVTRDNGFLGSACNTRLMIDGRLAAEIGPGETAKFYIPAGDVILGVNSNSVCGGGLKEREAKLSAGMVKKFRISIDTSGSMDLSPTAY